MGARGRWRSALAELVVTTAVAAVLASLLLPVLAALKVLVAQQRTSPHDAS